MTPTYPEIAGMDYIALEKALHAEAKLPYSVHCPLQMPLSRQFVFCDCAMNAYTLDMPCGWNDSNRKVWSQREQLRTCITSFAFGAAPFVPDFRRTGMRRVEGGYPIIETSFSAWGVGYKFQYACDPDGILHIRGTVDNFDFTEHEAHVWLRISKPIEKKEFFYHYRSFDWTADRWLPDDHVTFDAEEKLFHDEKGILAAVTTDDFTVTYEPPRQYAETDYNKEFTCETPYWVEPHMQLRNAPAMAHFARKLAPGEQASFEFALYTEAAGKNRKVSFSSFEEGVAAVKKCIDGFNRGTAQISLPGGKTESAVIDAVRTGTLQLLIDAIDYVQPCQGGLSERFFVWVWEAAGELRPMLRLGYFDLVKRVLEFVWSLQDGGCPPIGEFTTLEGSIGTTGPKWCCTTGIALSWAVEYLRLSGDEDFKARYLEKMVRAGNWIAGEVRATRKPGNPFPGIMPPCRASDGDYGQCISMTDSCSLNGLAQLAGLLTELGHPRAEEFTKEARQYKHDLDAVMDSVTHPDGFIERSVGDQSGVCRHFDNCSSVIYNYAHHTNTMEEPRMQKFFRYMEKNIFHGWFTSEITRGIYYIGNLELVSCKAYLELGEWKKAYAIANIFRRFVVTPDLALTQERYSEDDCGFTPWQPNASNNGRFLEMEVTRLWHEAPGRVIVGGALAPWDVRQSDSGLGFEGVYTSYGKTTLRMTEDGIVIDCTRPVPAGTRFVQPGGEDTLAEAGTHIELPYRPAPIFE